MIGQLDFDDYDLGFKGVAVEQRLERLFPMSELLGYLHFYDWSWAADYWVAIRTEGRGGSFYYYLRSVTLYHDGKAHPGYISSEDFTPHSFESKSKGRKWIWRSVDHREDIYQIALKNYREQLRKYPPVGQAKPVVQNPTGGALKGDPHAPDPNQLTLF